MIHTKRPLKANDEEDVKQNSQSFENTKSNRESKQFGSRTKHQHQQQSVTSS
jgi:hypothetical protein